MIQIDELFQMECLLDRQLPFSSAYEQLWLLAPAPDSRRQLLKMTCAFLLHAKVACENAENQQHLRMHDLSTGIQRGNHCPLLFLCHHASQGMTDTRRLQGSKLECLQLPLRSCLLSFTAL